MERKVQNNPVVKRVRQLLSLSGMQPPHTGTDLSLIFTLLAFYFGFETCICLIKNWPQIHSRLLALEDIIISIIMIMCCMEFAYAPAHIQCLLNILDESYFNGYAETESEQKKEIIKKAVDRERITAKSIETLSFITAFNLNILPIFILIKKMVEGESLFENVEDLPLPFEYSYTFVNCNLVSFLVIYAVESIWFIISAPAFACCVYMVTVLAMRRVKTELDLLIISLNDLDKSIGHDKNLGDEYNQLIIEQKLKSRLRNFVRHHYFIIQKVNELNMGLKLTPTITLQAFCSLICFCLWYIVKGEEIVLKVKYVSFLIPLLIYLFLYAAAGQDIINGQEQLAITLFECPWMDKPKWFKTSIATMMLFVNKPLYVKQFGIYKLDMPYFSKILNAGYSYFNLLNTVQ
ncbi:hypothetical protein LSTR_LSTR012188 [Laodelphax striatellus]|uniref:Odorant receptor n=1 Tax=Laodelphax striatellus TaxID=195883 RepID=A0A482WLL3_LAOST|nr:hypothetical protein LSTR_LSTR012188 [Laodelphax striatellus]